MNEKLHECPPEINDTDCAVAYNEGLKAGVKLGMEGRTPDPMTSVVQWVRYDGTPETVPEQDTEVLLLSGGSYGLVRGEDSYKFLWRDKDLIYLAREGDLWAYLPTPPSQRS